MAVGDVFANIESVADDGYMTIRPASGHEAVITYITVNGGGKVNVYHTDGTLYSKIINLEATGGDALPFAGQGFGITNARYLLVENKNGADLIIGFTGSYTKVSA